MTSEICLRCSSPLKSGAGYNGLCGDCTQLVYLTKDNFSGSIALGGSNRPPFEVEKSKNTETYKISSDTLDGLLLGIKEATKTTIDHRVQAIDLIRDDEYSCWYAYIVISKG